MTVILGCAAIGLEALIVTVFVFAAREGVGMHRRGVARLTEHRARVDAKIPGHAEAMAVGAAAVRATSNGST